MYIKSVDLSVSLSFYASLCFVLCNENLPKLSSKLVRMTCCGKGAHIKCRDDFFASSMSDKQKGRCMMCRTESAKSAEEDIKRLQRWVDKGKAWAQTMLGQMYRNGQGVDQSYQQAKELYELAATQGNA